MCWIKLKMRCSSGRYSLQGQVVYPSPEHLGTVQVAKSLNVCVCVCVCVSLSLSLSHVTVCIIVMCVASSLIPSNVPQHMTYYPTLTVYYGGDGLPFIYWCYVTIKTGRWLMLISIDRDQARLGSPSCFHPPTVLTPLATLSAYYSCNIIASELQCQEAPPAGFSLFSQPVYISYGLRDIVNMVFTRAVYCIERPPELTNFSIIILLQQESIVSLRLKRRSNLLSLYQAGWGRATKELQEYRDNYQLTDSLQPQLLSLTSQNMISQRLFHLHCLSHPPQFKVKLSA